MEVVKIAANEQIKAFRKTSINKQLYKLLVIVIFPLLVMIATLLFMLVSFNQEYVTALQNANAASEFNNNFKDNLDLEMWYHVIYAKSEDELPWDEVEHAKQILQRMQKTTTLNENRWRIQSMLKMCNNLSEYMLNIARTKSYDQRMEKLEKDIYTITELIKSYMHDYTYNEVKELTRLQDEISGRALTTIVAILIISMLLIVTILWYSLRFTQRITMPVSQLCRKVQKLGDGDFSIEPIETRSEEIKTLDDGFNEMVVRINALREKEIRDQNELHRTEFELLQAQINPHFLYNTLDSIVWLAETHRDSDVVKMVTSLSVFFRNSLSKGRDIITLEAEKNQVKSYLEIQKIRYSDILEYSIDIPKELLQYEIPKLTLQPLVENAIYHGTKHKRAIGKITIEGRQEKEKIFISVSDNGVGISEEHLKALRAGVYEDRHTGLGLANVHKRLKLYCGEEYGLYFDSVHGQRTIVTVVIPKKSN